MTEPQDGLAEYQQRRLELADITRALLHVVHALGDEQRETDVRKLLTRLAAGRFRLAVVGQFSRGKSTLMNALLAAAYLPMGTLPMTSVVTTVRYGSRARALIRSAESSFPVEVPVADISRFVARQSADRARMRVASVEVQLPAEFLRLGFEFVDTPGIGSAVAANTAATLAYLPQADALVFVTAFDSPLTEAETAFLKRAAPHAGRLFVVVNKRDLVADSDAGRVIEFVRRWLRENLGITEPEVFGISALDALRGAAQADGPVLAGSGVGPLRAAVTQFVTAERGVVSLRNVARAVSAVLGLQLRDLQAGRPAADGGDARAAVETTFAARVSELLDRERQLEAELRRQAEAAVIELFASRGTAWVSALRASVAASAGLMAAADGDPARGEGTPGDALEAIGLAGTSASAAWLAQRAGEIQEEVLSRSAAGISAILELARSPRDLGAAVAGGTAVADAAAPDGAGSPAGWSADDVPALATPVVGWKAATRLPGRRNRRRGRADAGDARRVLADVLAESAERFSEQARAAFRTGASRWAAQLGRQCEGLTTDEAAQFLRYLKSEPADADVAVLAGLRIRTAGFLAALQTSEPARTVSEAPSADRETGQHAQIGPCVVCAEVEALLTDYLVRGQYLLATSEAGQAQHAQAGGFCSLHTWQYAQIASPLGISAGYARLAVVVASELDSITARSASPAELGRAVADLTHGRACPACAVLAEGEQRSVARVASQASDTGPARLCLRHVALVLGAGPPPAAARHLVSEVAAGLRQAAEDMRAYALKREALRRSLITEEEAGAYESTLQLLAGKPALVQPWSRAGDR